MHLRRPLRSLRPLRTSVLATALTLGLISPQVAWSQPEDPDPDQLELAEELGYDVDDPQLQELLEQEAGEEAGVGTMSASADAPDGDTPDGDGGDLFAEESETGQWIVVLEDPAVATYDGGVKGLAATSTSATGDAKLDVESPESRAYATYLEQEQDKTLDEIAEELGIEVEVTQTYRYALNGMAIRAGAEEAAAIAELPGVAWVEPEEVWELETDVSNDILGSPAIWGGDTGSGLDTRGEGVIVGMIDSGVNPAHPSFAATDGEGYTHTNPYGDGVYVGVCAEGATPRLDICNDKLIGAYAFYGSTPIDRDGHGSHVGSTMAGNAHDAVFTVGDTEFTRAVSGVAPRANVISYKVCDPGCPSSATVAAVDMAIANGTDVLNYSISGPDNPWGNTVDRAFLSGFEAGIYIAASAGNTGPGVGTVTKTAPWNATVAATNSHRLIAHEFSVTGPEPVPADVQGLSAVPGNGPGVAEPITGELREVAGNTDGCSAFPEGAFDGTLALIERGGCTFTIKVDNAAAAGATGVVMTNHVPGPPVVMGGLDTTDIPAVMISFDEGQPLRDFVRANTGTTVLLDSSAALSTTPEWAKMVADFSGRGPSSYDLLNPTFAAPGRNILAATAADGDDTARYEFMQGTSMSSPHGAGAGALLRGLHPDWSPAMIRSALASTADNEGMLKDDGVTPATAFDVGSGMVDLEAAGRVGIVMDETHANFVAANPATGGDPRTLNLPAIVDLGCPSSCTFERTVTSVSDASATYTVSSSGPAGLAVTVEPSTFSLAPGATQELTVTVDVTGDVTGDWLMGQIDVTTDGTHAGGAAIADVHYPVTVLAANPVVGVSPTSLTSTIGVDEQHNHTVTIRNTGTAALAWSVAEDTPECALPEWATVDPASGRVAQRGSQTVTVTFDSSDMGGGTYEGTLCLATNDPAKPLVQVALSLTVEEIPAIGVDPTQVEVTLPADEVTTETVSVTNAGYGVLEWTFDDPDAGPSDERVQLLRDGVLLTPVASGDRQVVAFDPEDGTLLDEAFLPSVSGPGTPQSVLATLDNTGFLVSNQTTNVIRKFDLDGNDLGVWAPHGGPDTTILQNMRGMAWSPEGTLVVTVASGGNADSLIEFDQDGTYLGHYVAPGLDGLDGPWMPLFRDDDLLVSANGSKTIHSFSVDGKTANEPFSTLATWPVQLAETESGTVLAAVWSASGGGIPIGVHEFSADGELLWSGAVPGGSNYGGVQPLGNGNMLITTGQGVYELGRDGTVEQEWAGPRTRMMHEAHMPDLMGCQTPEEISWLDVEPSSGSNARGETTDVTLRLDSTGLVDGDYTAQLCVSSNDELRPYVPVTVSMTVTRPVCDTTITGVRGGGLTVSDTVCVDPGGVVNGGVTVEPGGQLFMDGARVNGGIVATDADWVVVTGSDVRGEVTVTGTSRQLILDGNAVSETVTVDRNRTGETPIVIAENHVGGDLTCSDNEPDPVNDDRPNTVDGRAGGQCADL